MKSTQVHRYLAHQPYPYEVIAHAPAYTARETAERIRVSQGEMAKTVVLSVDGRFVLAVLPASAYVDFDKVRALTGAHQVFLAREWEFDDLFGDCEPGAMPPFGPLFNMTVLVDRSLCAEPTIVFNGGTHRDALRMRYADFEELTNPEVGDLRE